MGKLKITKVKEKLITFDKMNEGDFFKYDNDIFIKTKDVRCRNDICNSYNLTTKTFAYIGSSISVIDIFAELIVY